jgi:hypothetical protein
VVSAGEKAGQRPAFCVSHPARGVCRSRSMHRLPTLSSVAVGRCCAGTAGVPPSSDLGSECVLHELPGLRHHVAVRRLARRVRKPDHAARWYSWMSPPRRSWRWTMGALDVCSTVTLSARVGLRNFVALGIRRFCRPIVFVGQPRRDPACGHQIELAAGRLRPRLLPARGLLLRLGFARLARLAWRRILLRPLR